jgi:hypothetical protein
MSDSEKLVIYAMPSLIATLLNREQAKGSPLTEAEVIEIYVEIAARQLQSRLTLRRRLMPSAATRTLTRRDVGSSGRKHESNSLRMIVRPNFVLRPAGQQQKGNREAEFFSSALASSKNGTPA